MSIKKIAVFDFDGTLFLSPEDTPENHKRYEKHAGMPWLIDKVKARELSKVHKRFIGIRSGWWGRAETLEPPLVPDPAPREWFVSSVCDQLAFCKTNPDLQPVIVTGRHSGLRSHVVRILGDGKLAKVQRAISKRAGKEFYTLTDEQVILYCLGDDEPIPGRKDKPPNTLHWKLWLFNQFQDAYPEATEIEIWEDRDDHVEFFRQVTFKNLKVIVNHVKGRDA